MAPVLPFYTLPFARNHPLILLSTQDGIEKDSLDTPSYTLSKFPQLPGRLLLYSCVYSFSFILKYLLPHIIDLVKIVMLSHILRQLLPCFLLPLPATNQSLNMLYP